MSEAAAAADNPLSFLNPAASETLPPAQAPETPSPEAPEAPAPAQDAGQPRGADGKFGAAAPAEPAPAPAEPVGAAPEPPPVAPAPAAPEPGHVPISSLLDEREKRQALQKELEALKAAQTKPAATPAPTPAKVPDPVEDPAGYREHLASVVEESRREARREVSRLVAVQSRGEDQVAAEEAWAAQKCQAGIDGTDMEGLLLNQQLLTSPNPYEVVRAAFQRHQMLEQVTPDEFAQYQAWKAAQAAGATPPAPTPAAPAPAPAPAKPPPTPPPASIAATPSAGGVEATSLDPSEPFKALFHR